MKFLRVAQVVVRVGLTLSGVVLAGAAAAGLAPTGCRRGVERELAGPVRPALFRAMVSTGPAWEMARVIRVVDGDTYERLVGGQVVRLRLLGVDAPEHDQAFGAQATDSVRTYLSGRLVRVQRQGVDLYGRALGVVRVPVASAWPAPVAVALDSLLVVRGWAWAWDPTRTVAARAQQQVAAQRAGRGLWKCGKDAPMPPKQWRGFTAAIKRRYGVGCTW